MSRASAIWVLIALSTAPACAQNGLVVLLADPQQLTAYGTSLQVELAPRGQQVVLASAPVGATLADRALIARGAAHEVGAGAALWTEIEADGSASVRAVSANSELVAWAPLSGPFVDGRVFALVAVSLLDELLSAPAQQPRDVHITVHVPWPQQLGAPQTPASTALPPPPQLPPAQIPPTRLSFEPPQPPRARGPYLEIGAAIAGVAYGVDGGAGVYLHQNLRFALHLRATAVLIQTAANPNVTFGGNASLSLAYVSSADDGRFEAAIEAGLIAAETRFDWAMGILFGGYFGWSWGPMGPARIGFRLGTYGAYVAGTLVPAAVLTLHMQISP